MPATGIGSTWSIAVDHNAPVSVIIPVRNEAGNIQAAVETHSSYGSCYGNTVCGG